MSVPIVIVHRGNQGYLKRVITSALKTNNQIILIGDNKNKTFPGWINEASLKSTKYNDFANVYKHYSTNTPEFELVCFERYFLTYEYLKQNNIPACIMMDSDVVLFDKLDSSIFNNYDFACGMPPQEEFQWFAAPNFAYWTIGALEAFIDYCIDMYQNHIERIELKWNWHQTNNIGGGICDMSLLYLFVKDTTLKFLNTDDIYTCIMDTKFNLSKQGKFECIMNAKYNIKKILFKDNTVFFEATTHELLPVLCIHAQGKNKKHIRSLSRNHFSDYDFFIDERLWNIHLFLQKAKRKLKINF